jgi:endonuclease/exonuclease/phosphatase family metal-dependent hydrolase
MSWNLREFPFTVTTIDSTTEVLSSLAPDVVAVQEISDPTAFSDLVDALPGYAGVLNDDAEGFLRLGLLYREERVTVTDVETLFVGNWFPFPRPPLKAHVAIEGDSTIDFDVVVLHLKAQVDGESQQRRELACEELDAWVQAQLAGQEEQDYVLLGDFNDRLLDPPQSNVFDAFLSQPDVYQFLTLPVEEDGYYSYIPFQSMIDHVLITSDMSDEVGNGQTEVLELDQVVESYGTISDHRPVRTILRW